MHRLPELRMPEDWKQRTRVFVTAAAKPRRGLAPLVSREIYDAERGRAGKKKAFDINGPAEARYVNRLISMT